jgi:Na+-transporting NADH:ubiquinone oxidoreductase subunit NqrF
MSVTLVGLASGRENSLEFTSEELNRDLLSWLRSKGITIASSCDGEGVCKKCNIQNGWLTCELTLKEFLERQPDGKIFVSYL